MGKKWILTLSNSDTFQSPGHWQLRSFCLLPYFEAKQSRVRPRNAPEKRAKTKTSDWPGLPLSQIETLYLQAVAMYILLIKESRCGTKRSKEHLNSKFKRLLPSIPGERNQRMETREKFLSLFSLTSWKGMLFFGCFIFVLSFPFRNR